MHAMTLWQVLRSLTRALHCPVLQDLALDGERGAPQWLQVVAADFMGCRFLLGFRGRLRGVLERFCTLPVRPFRTVTAPSTCKESASTLSRNGTVAEMQVLEARGMQLSLSQQPLRRGDLKRGRLGVQRGISLECRGMGLHQERTLFYLESPPHWSITPPPQQ